MESGEGAAKKHDYTKKQRTTSSTSGTYCNQDSRAKELASTV